MEVLRGDNVRKVIILSGFLSGVFLVLYGFFLTATAKGLIIMLLGVGVLVTSLFLYNLRR